MGKLIKGKRNEGPKYTLKRSKGITQKMERLDFCELLIAIPNGKESIKYDEDYKFFNLQIEAKILNSSDSNENFIDYWRGHITVLLSEVKIKKDKKKDNDVDKVRIKNLLYPLKKLYIHGQWKEITDEKLTFSCDNYDDNFLKLDDDNKLIFGRNFYEISNSSFKSSDWVMEKMKTVIDKVY